MSRGSSRRWRRWLVGTHQQADAVVLIHRRGAEDAEKTNEPKNGSELNRFAVSVASGSLQSTERSPLLEALE